MRTACAFALLLLAGAAAPGQEVVPNALTPKEVADGWLLLFDGETAFGWKVEGPAEVKGGALVLGRGGKAVAYPTTFFGPNFDLRLEWQGQGTVLAGDR